MPNFGKFQITREPLNFAERLLLGHCFVHRTSFICANYLEEERKLQVLESAAGFYIGCETGVVEGMPGEPLSRDSKHYYATYEDALQALVDRTWTQRLNP